MRATKPRPTQAPKHDNATWNGILLTLCAANCLNANSIHSIKQAWALGHEGLLEFPKLGKKTAVEIVAATGGETCRG